MGLSNETRLSKFYFALFRLRRKLERLNQHLQDRKKYDRRDQDGVVKSLIQSIDKIAGANITRQDHNNLYWVTGPCHDGYQAIFQRYYGLAGIEMIKQRRQRRCECQREDEDENPLDEFRKELDYLYAAQQLRGHLSEDDQITLIGLAYWWTAWQEVDSILYPLNRYEDDLFPKSVIASIEELIGKFANTRYAVLKEEPRVFTSEDQIDEIIEIENVFLCKYQLMHLMLDDLRTKKELAKAFDRDQFIMKIRKMSLAEVEAALERFAEQAYQDSADSMRPNLTKEGNDLFGPKPRTRQALDAILDRSPNYDECKAAYEERERVYSTGGGGWWLRFDENRKCIHETIEQAFMKIDAENDDEPEKETTKDVVSGRARTQAETQAIG